LRLALHPSLHSSNEGFPKKTRRAALKKIQKIKNQGWLKKTWIFIVYMNCGSFGLESPTLLFL